MTRGLVIVGRVPGSGVIADEAAASMASIGALESAGSRL
jgi:hypothetical protein